MEGLHEREPPKESLLPEEFGYGEEEDQLAAGL
jgi:hypothetical protein